MLEAISPNQKFRYKEEDEEEKNWGHNIFYFILLMICIFIILYFNCKFCIIDFFFEITICTVKQNISEEGNAN